MDTIMPILEALRTPTPWGVWDIRKWMWDIRMLAPSGAVKDVPTPFLLDGRRADVHGPALIWAMSPKDALLAGVLFLDRLGDAQRRKTPWVNEATAIWMVLASIASMETLPHPASPVRWERMIGAPDFCRVEGYIQRNGPFAWWKRSKGGLPLAWASVGEIMTRLGELGFSGQPVCVDEHKQTSRVSAIKAALGDTVRMTVESDDCGRVIGYLGYYLAWAVAPDGVVDVVATFRDHEIHAAINDDVRFVDKSGNELSQDAVLALARTEYSVEEFLKVVTAVTASDQSEAEGATAAPSGEDVLLLLRGMIDNPPVGADGRALPEVARVEEEANLLLKRVKRTASRLDEHRSRWEVDIPVGTDEEVEVYPLQGVSRTEVHWCGPKATVVAERKWPLCASTILIRHGLRYTLAATGGGHIPDGEHTAFVEEGELRCDTQAGYARYGYASLPQEVIDELENR